MHPGQRNTLDALAKRYGVDATKRELHGALLDAQILAEIYLAMTGGQVSLLLGGEEAAAVAAHSAIRAVDRAGLVLHVARATAEEQAAHDAMLAGLAKQTGRPTLWQVLADADAAAAAPALAKSAA
jgi:DNA polymerase-3 subunit epsilon